MVAANNCKSLNTFIHFLLIDFTNNLHTHKFLVSWTRPIVCFFIWLTALLVVVGLASLGSCWGGSSVVLVAVLMLLRGVWWCLLLFPCHMCLFFVCFYPSLSIPPSSTCVPRVCAWCLSQLPSSSLSPYSTPPIPSPANGPPSPKFGRDPLSYCLKEINKTVKPRISSFRTLKRTVSVTCLRDQATWLILWAAVAGTSP